MRQPRRHPTMDRTASKGGSPLRVARRILVLVPVLILMLGALARDAGSSHAATHLAASKHLTIGNIGWDEDVAVSNLTKLILEKDFGYTVNLPLADVGVLFTGVAKGNLDAFQDVWTPIHNTYLSKLRGQIVHLPSWYIGKTALGLAAPTYMRTNSGKPVTSIDQLNDTNVQDIIGIEPGAVVTQTINSKVIPAYHLKQRQIASSTAAMLAEVARRYKAKQSVVWLAWSPHWMNQKYKFNYLKDPKNAFGDAAAPAQLSTIVRKGLAKDDPVAYAFLKAIRLTDKQVNQMELFINKAGDPATGVANWLAGNGNVVQPWIRAAKQAQKTRS
ncbi:MAG: glycine betaine ABC transporter substrate-binding protein [Chloroflexi bacterium]|nr:glycine betaine ABC transporter substrate-binding protein [Chloroflexota bacterium]